MVHCGTGPSSGVRARAPPVQHLLRGGYKRGLHTFQGGQIQHDERFGASKEENRGEDAGEATCGGSALATSLWGMHALRLRCRSRLTTARAAEEDEGGDRGRVSGVWPHGIEGQD